MKNGIFLALLIFLGGNLLAADRITRSEYIDQWKDEAIHQMVMHGIPASITLAQGILESGDGNSELASKSNNHFGIKCHSDWKGKKVYHDDDRKGECFRKYPSAHQSFEDHSEFLKKKRYASLFELKITDYKGWAKGLRECGYATNRKYATLLIQLIETNNLTQYDEEGLAIMKGGTAKREKKKKKKETAGGEWDQDETLPNVTLNQRRTAQLSSNRIKYILAENGDTPESIAKELEVMPWQIRKYNDLQRNDRIVEGAIIYLQPKRRSAKQDWHTVKEGETLRDISQQHGIKMKHIRSKNNLGPNEQIQAGMKLSLRKRIRLD